MTSEGQIGQSKIYFVIRGDLNRQEAQLKYYRKKSLEI